MDMDSHIAPVFHLTALRMCSCDQIGHDLLSSWTASVVESLPL